MLVIKNTDKIKNRRIAGGEYRIVDMNRIYLIDKETGIGKQWYCIRVIKNRTGISQFVQLNREEDRDGVYQLQNGKKSKDIVKEDIQRMDVLIQWIEYLIIQSKTI